MNPYTRAAADRGPGRSRKPFAGPKQRTVDLRIVSHIRLVADIFWAYLRSP